MKGVGEKPESLRRARAAARLRVPAHCLTLLESGDTEKGDPLATARVAGILAAKRTDEILPLCHPLPLQRAEITFELGTDAVEIVSEVQTIAPTGVEMEALTAAAVAGLTLYDMLKPYADQSELALVDTHLIEKTGGKSDHARRLPAPVSAAVLIADPAAGAAAERLAESLREAGFEPVALTRPADEGGELAAALRGRLDAGVGFIATVGGTGIGLDDTAVEAVAPFVTTELPGLMEAARVYAQRRGPHGALGRGVAGLAGDSLLVTFPGDEGGVEDTFTALLPSLVRLFESLRGGRG